MVVDCCIVLAWLGWLHEIRRSRYCGLLGHNLHTPFFYIELVYEYKAHICLSPTVDVSTPSYASCPQDLALMVIIAPPANMTSDNHLIFTYPI